MNKAREDFIQYCMQTDKAGLTERASSLRDLAAKYTEQADEIEAFMLYRPDLKAEEPPAPEKAKRKPNATKGSFDELRDTKNKVVLFLGRASPALLDKFNAGLDLNHGLTTARMDEWSLTDAQNAWAVIRGLEMNLSQILDTSKPPF